MTDCTWAWDKPQHVHHACKFERNHGGKHECKWCGAVYR
jgi:hypothetical protein